MSIEQFRSMPASKKDRLKWVSGHVEFGLDQQLPGTWKYVAFVRDPIKRIVSEYNYIRNSRWHSRNRDVRNLSIIEFAKGERPNLQTRYFAGIECNRELHQSDLDLAIERSLDSNLFEISAPSSMFDQALLILKHSGVLDDLRYVRRKSAKIHPNETSESDLQMLGEINQFDVKLVQAVTRSFEEKVSSILGSDVEGQLADFRALNEKNIGIRQVSDYLLDIKEKIIGRLVYRNF